jgi:isopentenyl-diphosphate Delta-isomerase
MEEEIVLLSGDGHALGPAPKAASHHDRTPLHLAFSCYLIDETGRVLISRRAHDKRTFPSVWTNSACGHPAPGESLRDAVHRRVRTELGLEIDDLTLVLPDFRYEAAMANGVMENEMCPVVRGSVSGDTPVRQDPSEVAEADWRSWEDCRALVADPDSSPWFRMQMAQLEPLGEPRDWPAADASLLPAAIAW